MNEGYIKLFRRLSDKGWYQNSEYVHLWIHLLLKANHKGAEFMFNNKVLKLKAGQFVTGRNQLSKETGINQSKIERILKLFESEQQIEQQTTNKNRVISIISWEQYQQREQQIEQQTNNKRTTSEQQVNTNKNDKNEYNDKNDNKKIELPFYSDDFLDAWKTLLSQPKWKRKTDAAIKASIKKIVDKPELVSIAMINNAIAGGWQGLFDLNEKELAEVNKQILKNEIQLRDSKRDNKW